MLRQGDSNHQQKQKPRSPSKKQSRRQRSQQLSPMAVQYIYPPVSGTPVHKARAPNTEANEIIDMFCRLSPQEVSYMEWLVDIEFCIPTEIPTNRHIAYYDSNKRMVMSASQANTVHPDFLQCNERFRNMALAQFIRKEVHVQMNAITATMASQLLEQNKSSQSKLSTTASSQFAPSQHPPTQSTTSHTSLVSQHTGQELNVAHQLNNASASPQQTRQSSPQDSQLAETSPRKHLLATSSPQKTKHSVTSPQKSQYLMMSQPPPQNPNISQPPLQHSIAVQQQHQMASQLPKVPPPQPSIMSHQSSHSVSQHLQQHSMSLQQNSQHSLAPQLTGQNLNVIQQQQHHSILTQRPPQHLIGPQQPPQHMMGPQQQAQYSMPSQLHGQPLMPQPVMSAMLPQNYRELYRLMEDQKKMTNALQVASARHGHPRQN